MRDVILRRLEDPDVDREVRDIKRLLERLPVYFGFGAPEGEVAAQLGSLYLNFEGGASTTMYVKESGDDTKNGWVAK